MLTNPSDRAGVLAMKAHEGQVDKQGRDYALARRLWEERAEKALREAREKAPRFMARVPEVSVRAWDPGALPDCGDANVMGTLDVIGDYLDVMVAEHTEPVVRFPRFAAGGIVRPEPLVCDCGHPDTLHRTDPGVGCTHRPYCLCVHPTGQRVPRRPVAPPFAPDPALIVRTIR